VTRKQVHIIVTGRVQMVGFRYNAINSATEHGLVGWVRNTRDGHVEIIAEGSAEGMEAFIKWCWIGPRGGLVEDVRVEWREPTGEFTRFDARYLGDRHDATNS